jgi:hypothetical protein
LPLELTYSRYCRNNSSGFRAIQRVLRRLLWHCRLHKRDGSSALKRGEGIQAFSMKGEGSHEFPVSFLFIGRRCGRARRSAGPNPLHNPSDTWVFRNASLNKDWRSAGNSFRMSLVMRGSMCLLNARGTPFTKAKSTAASGIAGGSSFIECGYDNSQTMLRKCSSIPDALRRRASAQRLS